MTVEMDDDREFKTTDMKGDAGTDVGIVRIKGIERAKIAELEDSDQMKLGQLILVVGYVRIAE